MVDKMKRLLLITIIACAVAILCGCNQESNEKNVVSETQSSQKVSQTEHNTESIQETEVVDSNNDNSIEYTQADSTKNNDKLLSDNTEKSHSEASTNQEATDNNHIISATEEVNEKIEQNETTKVNEAEIDFSELE